MKTVIEMARAAGFPKWDDHEPVTVDMYERLVGLARADEREACAKVVTANAHMFATPQAAESLANAIRARGTT